MIPINITVLHINDAKIVQKIDLAKENIDYFFSEREFLYKSWNHRYRYLTYTRKVVTLGAKNYSLTDNYYREKSSKPIYWALHSVRCHMDFWKEFTPVLVVNQPLPMSNVQKTTN